MAGLLADMSEDAHSKNLPLVPNQFYLFAPDLEQVLFVCSNGGNLENASA
jgi:hypothetical protein